jgi:hypothetical protein
MTHTQPTPISQITKGATLAQVNAAFYASVKPYPLKRIMLEDGSVMLAQLTTIPLHELQEPVPGQIGIPRLNLNLYALDSLEWTTEQCSTERLKWYLAACRRHSAAAN